MTALEQVAELLTAHGMREAFGVTGSGASLKVISRLEDRGVAYYPVAHEAAAALMAGGVFRATGRIAAAIAIKGPGVANLLPGVACNHLDGQASITIAEAYGSGVPEFRRHKRLDHLTILAPLVKGWATLDKLTDSLPGLLSIATAEPPGPVHLELRDGPGPDLCGVTASPATSAHEENWIELLKGSRRPVVIAGSLGLRRPWGTQVSTLKCPVFTTALAKGLVDECGPSAAGVYTGEGGPLAPESTILSHADLVLGLGLRNTEVLTPRRITHALLIDEIVGYSDGFQAGTVILDSLAANTALSVIAEKGWGVELVERSRNDLRTALLETHWSPARCIEVLNRLDWNYTLVVDTGSFCTIAEHLWVANPKRRFVGSGNARFMGVGLPTSIGVALARPGQPVVCVVGDGGVRPYLAELSLALEECLPLCVVLMSDGAYGSIAAVPQEGRTSRRAVRISRPSWWRAIQGMGAAARGVESADVFERALTEWKREGPLFIEAAFDAAEYVAMTAGLR